MRVGIFPETPIEWLVLRLNLAPQPIVDTHFSFLLARLIMVATKIGVFEALEDGPRTAKEIAAACGTYPPGTEKLLDALVSMRYLRPDAAGYRLTPLARKWLLKDSPSSLYNKMLFDFYEWDMTTHLEEYVKSGASLDLHHSGDAEMWRVYQRSQKDIAREAAKEVAHTARIPKGATRLLDVGGAHGLFSVELCRRHPGLSAVILELPEAIEHAAPLLAEENMGERVVHRAGDALVDDLGEAEWDVILISNLIHYFDADANRRFVARVAKALKPGGVFIIQETVRTASRFDADKPRRRMAALLDLHFAVTSAAGTWSVEEMSEWQLVAGLRPEPPIWSRSRPGYAQIPATKPG